MTFLNLRLYVYVGLIFLILTFLILRFFGKTNLQTNRIMDAFFRTPSMIGVSYLFIIIIFGDLYQLERIYQITEVKGKETQIFLSWYEYYYFSVVTITTLGYGDISPVGNLGRFLASVESISGVVTIGVFLNSIFARSEYNKSKLFKKRADYFIESILKEQESIIHFGSNGNIPINKIKDATLNTFDFKHGLSKLSFHNMVTPIHGAFHSLSKTTTIGLLVTFSLNKITDDVNSLLSHANYLDPELIEIITILEDNVLFYEWHRDYELYLNHNPRALRPHNMGKYYVLFSDIYRKYVKLKEYHNKYKI